MNTIYTTLYIRTTLYALDINNTLYKENKENTLTTIQTGAKPLSISNRRLKPIKIIGFSSIFNTSYIK